MAALVPVAWYVALLLVLLAHERACVGWPDWCTAVVAASVVWGMIAAVITEGLCVLRGLRRDWVLRAWTLMLLLALGAAFALRRRKRAGPPALRRPKVPTCTLVCAALIAVMLSAIGIIRVVAAPGWTVTKPPLPARGLTWWERHVCGTCASCTRGPSSKSAYQATASACSAAAASPPTSPASRRSSS